MVLRLLLRWSTSLCWLQHSYSTHTGLKLTTSVTQSTFHNSTLCHGEQCDRTRFINFGVYSGLLKLGQSFKHLSDGIHTWVKPRACTFFRLRSEFAPTMHVCVVSGSDGQEGRRVGTSRGEAPWCHALLLYTYVCPLKMVSHPTGLWTGLPLPSPRVTGISTVLQPYTVTKWYNICSGYLLKWRKPEYTIFIYVNSIHTILSFPVCFHVHWIHSEAHRPHLPIYSHATKKLNCG